MHVEVHDSDSMKAAVAEQFAACYSNVDTNLKRLCALFNLYEDDTAEIETLCEKILTNCAALGKKIP